MPPPPPPRLVVWDGAVSVLGQAAALHPSPGVEALRHGWGKVAASVRLGGGGPLEVALPLGPLGPADRVLIGGGLEVHADVLWKDHLDRDTEYALSERIVLTGALQYALAATGGGRVLNPPLGYTGTIAVHSASRQRAALRAAGFRVPRVFAGSPGPAVPEGVAVAREDFLGLDTLGRGDAGARKGLPYLPVRLLERPPGRPAVLVWLAGRAYRAPWSGEADEEAPAVRRLDRRSALFAQLRAFAGGVGTDVCEVLTVGTGAGRRAVSFVRTLGVLSHPAVLRPLLSRLLASLRDAPRRSAALAA